MDRKDIEEAVIAALHQSGLNPHRAAVGAGLPEDAIRNVLAGHEPKASRLAQICAALGLEFYIGPPRAEVAEGLSSVNLRDLEAGARALIRIVIEAGGDPIPDDLWPVLAARREKKASDEDLAVGPRVDFGELTESDSMQIFDHPLFGSTQPDHLELDPGGQWFESNVKLMTLPLSSGSTIRVDPNRKHWCPGEVYAFWLSGALVVRRAQEGDQGERLLVDDHPDSEPMLFPDPETMIGTVVWTSGTLLEDLRRPEEPNAV